MATPRCLPAIVALATLLGSTVGAAHSYGAEAAGALRLHPDNPRVFEFRGKPTVLVTSAEHYGAVLNLDFDYQVYLDELASKGLNYTRIFTGSYVELPGAFGIEKNTLAPAPGRLLAPWARSTTPGYMNGGNKFDLKRWDLAYFDRLKDFVAQASRRGIVVEVTLFSSMYGNPGWDASPLHDSNNINSVGSVDRKAVNTLDNGKLYAHQEAMVRQIVRALADADNVIFEIQNEPWSDLGAQPGNVSQANAASLAWQKKLASVITQEGNRAGRKPLIAQNIANKSSQITDPDPNVSVFNFHYSNPPDVIAMNAHISRVLGFDESGFAGSKDETYRKQGWAFVLAGGGLFNNLDYSFTVARPNGTDTQKAPGGGSAALRSQLGALSRFINGFGQDLVAMRPDTSFVKEGAAHVTHALAAPGRAYAVYLARGKADKQVPVTLSLALPFGAYDVQWLNPASGQNLASQRLVQADGVTVLKGPALKEDLAVRLVRSSVEPQTSELPKGPVATATSPDGRTQITLVLANLAGVPGHEDRTRLYYRVEQGDKANRKVVLPWSPLGVRRADQEFVYDLRWSRVAKKAVRERYKLTSGKALEQNAAGEEATVTLLGAGGGTLAVDLRAYNDGVAFRYRFPEPLSGWFEVQSEDTGFQVPAQSPSFMMAHDDANEWKPAYESDWLAEVPAGTSSPNAAGWSFPALFQIQDRWVLLTESGLDRGFAASRLAKDAPAGLYKVRLPDAIEGEGLGAVAPRWTLPWSLPWRVIVVGPDLNTIVETNLVTHLAAPSVVANTAWIKPGRSSWSWWSDSDSPQDYDRMVPFVDLAATMGWEYFLVDANWDKMKGGDWKQLAAYAKGKGVRLLLWYNSGGPNNIVKERPRDLMFEREARRAEMKQISDAGIAGLKVDFFQNDKQVTVQQYLDLLQDAADFKLLVNFHGCTLPHGWSRTYPNLMSHEAVKGAETYKFGKTFAPYAPVHNAILPFTRNVVGPMDYTPVTFFDMDYPHQTTYGHELATSVVFESGILHLADSVKAYATLPDAPKAFLKEVPVVWDETRFVTGHPGKLAVLARRKGAVWYVGGISGLPEASTANVALKFLGKDSKRRYDVNTITDGDTARSFSQRSASHGAGESIAVPLRARGGFVMRIAPMR